MHIGWDWASDAHDITVIDDAGQIIDRWAPVRDETAIAATLAIEGAHAPAPSRSV